MFGQLYWIIYMVLMMLFYEDQAFAMSVFLGMNISVISFKADELVIDAAKKLAMKKRFARARASTIPTAHRFLVMWFTDLCRSSDFA